MSRVLHLRVTWTCIISVFIWFLQFLTYPTGDLTPFAANPSRIFTRGFAPPRCWRNAPSTCRITTDYISVSRNKNTTGYKRRDKQLDEKSLAKYTAERTSATHTTRSTPPTKQPTNDRAQTRSLLTILPHKQYHNLDFVKNVSSLLSLSPLPTQQLRLHNKKVFGAKLITKWSSCSDSSSGHQSKPPRCHYVHMVGTNTPTRRPQYIIVAYLRRTPTTRSSDFTKHKPTKRESHRNILKIS
jgi:hypothetical protein